MLTWCTGDSLCPHGHQLSPASVFRLLHKLKGKIIFASKWLELVKASKIRLRQGLAEPHGDGTKAILNYTDDFRMEIKEVDRSTVLRTTGSGLRVEAQVQNWPSLGQPTSLRNKAKTQAGRSVALRQITGLACAAFSSSTALQNQTNTSSSARDSKCLHVLTA